MRLSPLLALALCVGCGARQATPAASDPARPSRPVVAFPEPARVQAAVTAGPPPQLGPLLPRGEVAVDDWTLRTTSAPGDPVYEPEGPLAPVLDAAAQQAGASLVRSASLRCVASEMARFYTTHEALPSERLTRYLLAACGSSAVGVGRAGTLGRVDAGASDAEFVRLAEDDIRAQIAPVLFDGGRVGFAMHRDGPKVAVIAVIARPKVELAPPIPPGADGLAIVRGRLLGEADAVFGLINRGPHRVARCQRTSGFALPEIELRCPMAEGDDAALVQINAMTLGRVLTEHVATVMVRRAENTAPPPFAARPVGEAAPIEAPTEAGPALVARLNALRREAGLGPVTLSTPQSEVSAQAAPYLLDRIVRDVPQEQDVLALGLLAGWQVRGGTIRWADIVGQFALGTHDVARWLSDAIEQPGGRWVLMRPDVRQLAAGAVPVGEPEALGLVALTYAFYEDVDHRADAEAFFERVVRERAARGLPPPRRMDGLEALWAHADALSAGREIAGQALRRALQQESQARRRSLRGFALETIDLSLGELPEPVLAARELDLGVAVAHTRAEGAAWGQYVVLLIFGA